MTARPPRPPALTNGQRTQVLGVATTAIERALIGADAVPPEPSDYDPPLREPAATFVTLERDRRLLGCIGTLEAHRPLVASVAHNALAAAFSDPRLPPVTTDDYEAMTVTVSYLSALEPMDVSNRDALAAAACPGRDGLVLEIGPRQATLLPSVWEQVPATDEFLDLLWNKAGLRSREWPTGIRVLCYVTDVFGDTGPRASVSSS
ncbi:MAG: AmmeMemoRadiSam system protein A [Acidimicrobiia bacterium]